MTTIHATREAGSRCGPQNDPRHYAEVDQEKGSCPQCSYDLTFSHSLAGLTWSFYLSYRYPSFGTKKRLVWELS